MSKFGNVAPLDLGVITVRPEWIDYNGHMNVAYYVAAFDLGLDKMFQIIELDESYFKQSNCSSFTLEAHINYIDEVKLGDPLQINARLLDFDQKRMHVYLEMHHATEKYLSATTEMLMMHIDMSSRSSSNYPINIYTHLSKLFSDHRDLPQPENCGRIIKIKRK
jgi:acyl-CoA thioester hydrolase